LSSTVSRHSGVAVSTPASGHKNGEERKKALSLLLCPSLSLPLIRAAPHAVARMRAGRAVVRVLVQFSRASFEGSELCRKSANVCLRNFILSAPNKHVECRELPANLGGHRSAASAESAPG